jgi:hypothetical protein
MQAAIDVGHGFTRCRTLFGIAHATWVKAIEHGDIRGDLSLTHRFADGRRRFDWAAIQAHYDTGVSVRDCIAHFRCTMGAWEKARKRGEIRTRRTVPWTAEEALARSKSRRTIKLHLLRAGIIVNRCDWCGLTEWRGRPLSIQIDHVNGIRDDHRLENLRMLCPNCHSQTDTFAARNKPFRKMQSRLAKW